MRQNFLALRIISELVITALLVSFIPTPASKQGSDASCFSTQALSCWTMTRTGPALQHIRSIYAFLRLQLQLQLQRQSLHRRVLRWLREDRAAHVQLDLAGVRSGIRNPRITSWFILAGIHGFLYMALLPFQPEVMLGKYLLTGKTYFLLFSYVGPTSHFLTTAFFGLRILKLPFHMVFQLALMNAIPHWGFMALFIGMLYQVPEVGRYVIQKVSAKFWRVRPGSDWDLALRKSADLLIIRPVAVIPLVSLTLWAGFILFTNFRFSPWPAWVLAGLFYGVELLRQYFLHQKTSLRPSVAFSA